MSRLIGRRRDKVFSSEYFDFNFEHFVVLQVSQQADSQGGGTKNFHLNIFI